MKSLCASMHELVRLGACFPWRIRLILFTFLTPVVASFPGLPLFMVFIQYNTWKRKSTKNGEGLETPIT